MLCNLLVTKTKFIFLLLPEIHIMDLAGPNQAIHEAIDFGADFEMDYCNLIQEITTASGIPIGKVKHFTEVEIRKGDYLIISGCNASYLTSDVFRKNKQLFDWLKELHQNEINLCSICSGAFVLAESGLLDSISCTTHFKKTDDLQQMYPKTKVVENILFTDQNGIYTSAGIASGIDLTLHIIEKLKGSHFAHFVARELVVYNRRSANSSQSSELLQFRNHIHSGIHKVQDWIIDNIHLKNNLDHLAEIASMSEHNFNRIFKKETNITVNNYITLIRKEKSRELLKNPNFSRIEIAHKIGLQSERQLSRKLNP